MPKQQILIVRCEGAGLLDITQMEPIQGDLKYLSAERKAELRARIESGFKEPISIWKHEGRNKILSGTQRWTILHDMRKDGWVIPKIPINITYADSLAEAKNDILGFSSQYGQITSEGMLDYLSDGVLTADDILKHTRLANFDTMKFLNEHMIDIDIDGVAEPEPAENGRVSSDGVKKVQLNFDEASYREFVSKATFLQDRFDSKSLSDGLLETVREAFDRHHKIA